jgi:hypothetical protein
MAVTASKITGTRKAMQRSWRPFTENASTFPVSILNVCCSMGVDEVGLTAMRNTSSFPLVMPPTIPPAWFVKVLPELFSIASLCWLPNIFAAAKPVPNSMARTAGMANTA